MNSLKRLVLQVRFYARATRRVVSDAIFLVM